MDQKRFNELFNDITRWIRQARRLKCTGDRLTSTIQHVLKICLEDKYGKNNQTPEFLENMEGFRGLTDARALLYGLAIENACKARLIKDGKIYIDDKGEAKNLRNDHNIFELVKQAGYKPNSEEEIFLDLLAYQLRTLAKYPIAKDLKTQNKFTGRAVGARVEEAILVQDIITKVLRDQDLISIFSLGYLARV